MSEGRWKYRQDTVTVGENSIVVRQLTAGERRDFAAASGKVRNGEMKGGDLPLMLMKFASISPRITTDEDVAEMPPELLDACTHKILELTGLKVGEIKAAAAELESPEKKDLTAAPLNS